jgi:hypothetical protein
MEEWGVGERMMDWRGKLNMTLVPFNISDLLMPMVKSVPNYRIQAYRANYVTFLDLNSI